ncbi:MAG TPA: class I SAM-dependent methyltransferase [Solirubrobacteraceae bacterium]|nr:class I SAM-dependent methyltransferase [Solirubrobacteraceae bacterium]
MDWNVGEYEHIAAQLLPAAQAVIDHADPRGGEHLVDVGCGTGNAALIAAERGARVTGIDPAQRLLDVAGAEAAARGVDARFLCGEAARLPLADSTAEAVVSVFGVIFASDAPGAVAEMARIATPGGRIVLSAWMPGGALADVMRVRRDAVAAGMSGGAAPFAWHDRTALTSAFAPHGFSVDLSEEQLAFIAASPLEFVETELRVHPGWIAARAVLEPRGEMQTVRDRALEIFEAANEDTGGFRVTSRYVVATARRE